MGTIAQELTRIQNAKASLKTSIENKGVQVPANTLIDGYPALVDQISGGGGGDEDLVNAVKALNNVDYMCYNCTGLTDKRIELMQAMLHYLKNCTSTKYTFAQNTRQVIAECARQLQGADLSHIVDFDYMFYQMFEGASEEVVIDLRGLVFEGNCRFMFARSANTTPTNNTIIKFDKNTFEQTTYAANLFYKLGSGVILDYYNDVNEISFINATNISDMFNQSNIKEYRFNGTASKVLNINISDKCTTLAGLFKESRFIKCFEEINFVGDLSSVVSTDNMFDTLSTYNSSVKKITGLNFENNTDNLIAPLGSNLSTASSHAFNNLGEFTLANGTTWSGTVNLNLIRIWRTNASTIRNGQTVGYWFEQFANSLGTKTAAEKQTIFIYTSLYNSLSVAQKALVTDKGYILQGMS